MIKQSLMICIMASIFSYPAVRAGDETTAQFKLYWKGLVIGEAGVELKQTQRDYAIYSKFETKGVLRLFVKGVSELNATGDLLSDGSLISKRMKTEGVWRGDRYARDIIFDKGGNVTKMEIIDPDEGDDDDDYIRIPVPRDQQHGPEPTSILIELMKAPWQQSEDGNVRYTSFNGSQVSETSLNCEKIAKDMPKRKKRVYQGKSIYCTLSMKVIAGGWQENPAKKKKNEKRRKKREKQRKKADQKDKKPMAVWLADVSNDGRYIPVEITVPTRWGQTVFTMTAYNHIAHSEPSVEPASVSANE